LKFKWYTVNFIDKKAKIKAKDVTKEGGYYFRKGGGRVWL
jgi:hypothetical protein